MSNPPELEVYVMYVPIKFVMTMRSLAAAHPYVDASGRRLIVFHQDPEGDSHPWDAEDGILYSLVVRLSDDVVCVEVDLQRLGGAPPFDAWGGCAERTDYYLAWEADGRWGEVHPDDPRVVSARDVHAVAEALLFPFKSGDIIEPIPL